MKQTGRRLILVRRSVFLYDKVTIWMEEMPGNCGIVSRRTKGGELMEDREIIRLYQKRD